MKRVERVQIEENAILHSVYLERVVLVLILPNVQLGTISTRYGSWYSCLHKNCIHRLDTGKWSPTERNAFFPCGLVPDKGLISLAT